MNTRTEQLLFETTVVLEHIILDWWLTFRDPHGGFYGEVLGQRRARVHFPGQAGQDPHRRSSTDLRLKKRIRLPNEV